MQDRHGTAVPAPAGSSQARSSREVDTRGPELPQARPAPFIFHQKCFVSSYLPGFLFQGEGWAKQVFSTTKSSPAHVQPPAWVRAFSIISFSLFLGSPQDSAPPSPEDIAVILLVSVWFFNELLIFHLYLLVFISPCWWKGSCSNSRSFCSLQPIWLWLIVTVIKDIFWLRDKHELMGSTPFCQEIYCGAWLKSLMWVDAEVKSAQNTLSLVPGTYCKCTRILFKKWFSISY